MFVLACALKTLDLDELVDYTLAMIHTGTSLSFGEGPIADKHSVGGIPGNRTTLIVVPILAANGLIVPKTSSRAITSPAGTADTMELFAEVALSPERLRKVVAEAGACIAWGGALQLAPADDILITVERPMELDTEAQMIASILAKKKTVGATHVLIDIPVGPTAKVRTHAAADHLTTLFNAVAERIGLRVEVDADSCEWAGWIRYRPAPRSARCARGAASRSLRARRFAREVALLAARLLEMTGVEPLSRGYEAARRTLDSGAALKRFDAIVDAQGRREMPPQAPWRRDFAAAQAGTIAQIDCWEISRIAKRAGAPSNASAGVKLYKTVGDTVMRGEPIFEIHAESDSQLQAALEYSNSVRRLLHYAEDS